MVPQLSASASSCDCSAKMTDSDSRYEGMDVDDDISTALDTETLADRDILPGGYSNSPIATPSSEALAIEIFEGRRCLEVDRSASLRRRAKVSKIRQHSFEYRLLETPQLDKRRR